jgi:hypothetical protein
MLASRPKAEAWFELARNSPRLLTTGLRYAVGTRFSTKPFHNVVLRTGTVPLDVLGDAIDDWIRRPNEHEVADTLLARLEAQDGHDERLLLSNAAGTIDDLANQRQRDRCKSCCWLGGFGGKGTPGWSAESAAVGDCDLVQRFGQPDERKARRGRRRSRDRFETDNAQTPWRTGHHPRPEDKASQQDPQPSEICKTSIPGSNPGGAPIFLFKFHRLFFSRTIPRL